MKLTEQAKKKLFINRTLPCAELCSISFHNNKNNNINSNKDNKNNNNNNSRNNHIVVENCVNFGPSMTNADTYIIHCK